MIRIVIPGKPRGKASVRGRVAKAKDGRQFVAAHNTTETRNAMAFVRMLAVEAMQGRPPLDGPIRLEAVLFYQPPARFSKKHRQCALDGYFFPTVKPDASNWLKLIEDALNGVVFIDDKDVCDVSIRKVYGEVAQQVVCVSLITGERA